MIGYLDFGIIIFSGMPKLLSLSAWLKGEGDIADPNPNQEHQAMKTEMQNEILQAVQTLSPLLREAILLRHWAGHTYREMSKILDLILTHKQLGCACNQCYPLLLKCL